jgi:hypothetical protein
METLHAYAVERDGNVTTDLDPRTQAIIEKMSRVVYVLSCHRQAVEKHSRQLAELQFALARIRARP